MSNILSLRIAEDLGYSRPQTLLNNIYLDQLCYGAMAEWLRTITCDVDPYSAITVWGLPGHIWRNGE